MKKLLLRRACLVNTRPRVARDAALRHGGKLPA